MLLPNPWGGPQPRATCFRCFRPSALCYCDLVETVPNRTRILIVQHPREEFHPLNTARLVEFSLDRVELLRGTPESLERQLVRLALPEGAALLYPSAESVDLSELSPDERPRDVVVLDGTWHQAKTLYRGLPSLQGLRKVRFTPENPSEYRIRKEPRDDYLSTIEAVAHCLERLEPALDAEPLRRTFRTFIDRSIALRPKEHCGDRAKKRRAERPHRFDSAVEDPAERVVLAYAEGCPQPGSSKRHPLVVRLESWETSAAPLELWLAPPHSPSSRLLAHLGKSEIDYEEARLPREEVERALGAYLHEGITVLGWNASTLAILRELKVKARLVQLKASYCDYKKFLDEDADQWGGLPEALEREGLEVGESSAFEGRVGLRLEQTRRITGWLRAEAAERRLG